VRKIADVAEEEEDEGMSSRKSTTDSSRQAGMKKICAKIRAEESQGRIFFHKGPVRRSHM
jgi:hypothetical protein